MPLVLVLIYLMTIITVLMACAVWFAVDLRRLDKLVHRYQNNPMNH